MPKLSLIPLVACAALISATQARAITYNVSDTYLAGATTATVTGTITTDGTIGVLTYDNISSYSLLWSHSARLTILVGIYSSPERL
jgi:hypothetical protein